MFIEVYDGREGSAATHLNLDSNILSTATPICSREGWRAEYEFDKVSGDLRDSRDRVRYFGVFRKSQKKALEDIKKVIDLVGGE